MVMTLRRLIAATLLFGVLLAGCRPADPLSPSALTVATAPPAGRTAGPLPAERSGTATAPVSTVLPGAVTPATVPVVTAPSATLPVATAQPATATPGAPAVATPDRSAGQDRWSVYTDALRPEARQGLVLSGLTQYSLTVTLPADLSHVDGRARIRYTNRTTATLDSIYLHLFPNLWRDGMTLSDVQVAGRPVSATLESGASLARVALPSPLLPDEETELDLRFSDPVPSALDVGNYGEFALQNRVLALAGFYPTVAVYDTAWHTETPATQGDVLYADASLYDVTLTAPADLQVVASGATKGRTDHPDGTTTWRLAGGPMRDFNIVASPLYQSSSRQEGEVQVNSYYLPEDAQGGEDALNWAVMALRTYQEAFGPYPYRELDVVETPTTAGGIEYPGLIVVAQSLYRDPQRRDFFEGATAHEVAHQWWYNVVGDDQVNTPWLDEAMAQYSTYLYYQAVHGDAGAGGFLASLQARWDAVGREDKPVGLPVAAYNGGEYSGIVYGRGPLFLIALRDQIGQDNMAEFLRRYCRAYAWNIATPADFQALAEAVSGQDLQPLFDKWVYPPG